MDAETIPLPVAQCDQEITEQDFATLIRIAADPQAQAGRPKRVPRRIPVRVQVRELPTHEATSRSHQAG